MPKHFVIEEEKKNHPPILIVDTNSGIKNTLLNAFVKELQLNGKIYVLTSKQVSQEVTKISPLSIHFLDKLSDSLNYAIIFLDEEAQKKKVIDIIEKLSINGTRIIVVIPYRVIERFIDVLLKVKDYRNVSIAFLGDLFGNSNAAFPLSKIIHNALINKEIFLSGNELLPVYPIYDVDAVSAIQYLLFGVKHPHPFYNVFYEHPETLISLAHLLKRHEPELSIRFGNIEIGLAFEKSQKDAERYIKDRTTVKPQYLPYAVKGFEKSISEFEAKKEMIHRLHKKNQLFKKPSRLLRFLGILKLTIIAFILYAILSFTLFFISIFLFRIGISSIIAGQIENGEKALKTSNVFYSVSKNTVFLLSAFPSQLTRGKLEDNLKAYDDISNAASEVIPVIKKIKNSNPTLSKTELEDISATIFRLYFVLERNDMPEFIKLAQSKEFEKAGTFLPIFPTIISMLGYDTPKSYLILFQNNTELRPTGGFIGSVGHLTLQNGKINDLQIQDVYDLDGQLTGHLEPHYIIRRYLQPHLYLRDSNFLPDFAATASVSALLYNMETGKRVDGVLAVDTEVLKKILNITGPIKIDGIGEVNSNNVVDLVHNSIQDSFAPGASTKRDTLKTLVNKITIILESDKSKQVDFLESLPDLLLEKHLLISLANPSLQKAVIGSGIAGSLEDLRIAKNTLRDYLSINEANIGVNKINKLIERKITYSAFLRSSTLSSDALIEYRNKGNEEYKAYIRLIIPKDSQIVGISLNGSDQKIIPAVTDPGIFERKNFKVPSGFELDQQEEDGHLTVGFIAKTPPQSTVRIRVLYQNPKIVPIEDVFTYSLLYIKQPGTLPYPLTIQLQTEGNYKMQNGNGSSPVLFDENVRKDIEVKAGLTRIKQ